MVTRIGRRSRAHLYIEEWIASKGKTDQQIADLLEVSRTTVWRWYKEQHRLDPQKIANLAWAIGCEPEDFWRPPHRPSLDAMVANAPDELFDQAKSIIQTLTRRVS